MLQQNEKVLPTCLLQECKIPGNVGEMAGTGGRLAETSLPQHVHVMEWHEGK